MSEVLRTVMQNAPYIGASIGVAAGMVAERTMIRHAAEERHPLNEIMGEVAEQTQQPSRFNRVGFKVLGPFAATCAVAGGIVGMAFQQEGEVKTKANLQMVVDRSGATGLADTENKTPADEVDSIIKEFASHEETSADIFVGQGGDVLERSYQEIINQVRPSGDAPMQRAVRGAIKNISDERLSGDNTKNAVVVITNGNDFGETDSVLRASKNAGVSLYVKDISDSTDTNTVSTMRNIAQKTGGEYLDEASKPEELYEQVKDKTSGEIAGEQSGSKHGAPEKIFASLLSIFAVGAVGRTRRKMPLTFNGSKIEQ